jgi:tRNA-specific 2-thiouridylase
VEKELDHNVLRVAQGHDHPALFHTHCHIRQLHWINKLNIEPPIQCSAKVRYRQQDQPCTIIEIQDLDATVLFNTAQRAITPGQALVFYDKELCLGGGTIENAYNPI